MATGSQPDMVLTSIRVGRELGAPATPCGHIGLQGGWDQKIPAAVESGVVQVASARLSVASATPVAGSGGVAAVARCIAPLLGLLPPIGQT